MTIGQKRWTWRTWGNSNGTRYESETKNQNGFMICILSLKTLICSRTCAISLQNSNHPIKFVHFRLQVARFSKYCLAEPNDVAVFHCIGVELTCSWVVDLVLRRKQNRCMQFVTKNPLIDCKQNFEVLHTVIACLMLLMFFAETAGRFVLSSLFRLFVIHSLVKLSKTSNKK